MVFSRKLGFIVDHFKAYSKGKNSIFKILRTYYENLGLVNNWL